MHIETNQLTSLTARSYCWRLCVNKQNLSGTDVRGGGVRGGGGGGRTAIEDIRDYRRRTF